MHAKQATFLLSGAVWIRPKSPICVRHTTSSRPRTVVVLINSSQHIICMQAKHHVRPRSDGINRRLGDELEEILAARLRLQAAGCFKDGQTCPIFICALNENRSDVINVLLGEVNTPCCEAAPSRVGGSVEQSKASNSGPCSSTTLCSDIGSFIKLINSASRKTAP